jgi:hypothetical protein
MFNLKKVIGLVSVLGISLAFSVSSFAYGQVTCTTGNLYGDYKKNVQAAISWWNGVEPNYVKFVELSTTTKDVGADLYCVTKFVNQPNNPDAGWVTNGDIYINVAQAITNTSRIQVIKHEMGHVIALSHDLSKTNIMSSRFGDLNALSVSSSQKSWIRSTYYYGYGTGFKGNIGIGTYSVNDGGILGRRR